MTRLNEFQKIIRSLDILLDVPVTAKIRTGVKGELSVSEFELFLFKLNFKS
jgi:hypothetical protein